MTIPAKLIFTLGLAIFVAGWASTAAELALFRRMWVERVVECDRLRYENAELKSQVEVYQWDFLTLKGADLELEE